MRYHHETMIRALGYATATAFLLVSCTKGDKVPSYLEVPSVALLTDPLVEGTASHKVQEIYTFVDDKAVGAWEFPARIPVLASGTRNLKIIAGIHRNGIGTDRIQYPFYDTWSGSVDLALEGTATVIPQFMYFPDLYYWHEAFEDAGNKFTVNTLSDTTLNTITDPAHVFEGNASAAFFLDTAHPFFLASTQEAFDAHVGPVFLELDYKCDHRFLIGVYYTVNGQVVKEPYLFIAPNGLTWNKIYVDLSLLFNTAGVSDREFYVEAQLDPTATSAAIYLDNFKVVHSGN